MNRRFAVLFALIFSLPIQAADPTPLKGKIQSVDTTARTITLIPEGNSAKPITLDFGRKSAVTLSGKPATISDLKPGQTVTVTVDPKTDVVIRLTATPAAESKTNSAEPDLIVVVVSGTGKDESAARKQGFANAVEQAVGVVVDAETVVKNDKVISEQILTYSDAIVKTYDLVGEPVRKDDLVTVKIKASVERRSLIERLGKDHIAVKDFSGKDMAAEVLSDLKASGDATALIKKAFASFPGDLVTAKAGKPKVVSKSETLVKLSIPVTFSIDEAKYKDFATALNRTLASVSLEKRKGVTQASLIPYDKTKTVHLTEIAWTLMPSNNSPYYQLMGLKYGVLPKSREEQLDIDEKIRTFWKDRKYIAVADPSSNLGRTIAWKIYRVDPAATKVIAEAYAYASAIRIDLINQKDEAYPVELGTTFRPLGRQGVTVKGEPNLGLTEFKSNAFVRLNPITVTIANEWFNIPVSLLNKSNGTGVQSEVYQFAETANIYYVWPQMQFVWDDLNRNTHYMCDQKGLVTIGSINAGNAFSHVFAGGYTKSLTFEFDTEITTEALEKLKSVRVVVGSLDTLEKKGSP